MTPSPQHSNESDFADLALAGRGSASRSQAPTRLANGEPLGTSGLVTLLAAAVILLSILAVTPGMGG